MRRQGVTQHYGEDNPDDGCHEGDKHLERNADVDRQPLPAQARETQCMFVLEMLSLSF